MDHKLLKGIDCYLPIVNFPFAAICTLRTNFFEQLLASNESHFEFVTISSDICLAHIMHVLDTNNSPSIANRYSLFLMNAVYLPKLLFVKSISHLVGALSFKSSSYGKRIAVADILSTLCIFCSGTLEQKSRFLFDLFKMNPSGVMLEEEHKNFMQRVVDNFRKLALLGSLDWSENDVKYYAIQARSHYRKDTNEITFIPSLQYEDFFRWMTDSAECKIISKFIAILNKLSGVLLSLADRATDIADVLLKKLDVYCSKSDPVLKMPAVNGALFRAYPIDRQQCTLSLCFGNTSAKKVYVRVDEIVVERGSKGTKTYSLTFYRMKAIDQLHRVERIDVLGLAANTLYRLSAYTARLRFQPIVMRTLAEPLSRKLNNQVNENKSILAVLPGDLSVDEAESFISNEQSFNGSLSVIFSGVVCPIEVRIRHIISLFQAGKESLTASEIDRIVSASLIIYDSVHNNEWEEGVRKLLGTCMACSHGPVCHADNHAENRHVTFFDGIGPWSYRAIVAAIQKTAGNACFQRISERISVLHSTFMSQIGPRQFYSTDQSTTTLLIGRSEGHAFDWEERLHLLQKAEHFLSQCENNQCNQDAVKIFLQSIPGHSAAAPSVSASPSRLLEYLKGRLKDDAIKKMRSAAVPPEHMVLIMRTPLDLLADARDLITDFSTRRNTKESVGATSTTATKIKITGRHEICEHTFESYSSFKSLLCVYISVW